LTKNIGHTSEGVNMSDVQGSNLFMSKRILVLMEIVCEICNHIHKIFDPVNLENTDGRNKAILYLKSCHIQSLFVIFTYLTKKIAKGFAMACQMIGVATTIQ
jgi:hypothetical protein